ncbi:MAG: NUDIX domain-containing protein [Nocardioides sp.]
MRERVAAIIEREALVLMVRQRARGDAGRHDGFEYLTLPGGGVEVGESPVDALAREVVEEVGLRVVSASCLRRVEHAEHQGGATSLFYVEVEEGPATLGFDPELSCDCPRLVGIDWITAPSRAAWRGVEVRSLLKIRLS